MPHVPALDWKDGRPSFAAASSLSLLLLSGGCFLVLFHTHASDRSDGRGGATALSALAAASEEV